VSATAARRAAPRRGGRRSTRPSSGTPPGATLRAPAPRRARRRPAWRRPRALPADERRRVARTQADADLLSPTERHHHARARHDALPERVGHRVREGAEERQGERHLGERGGGGVGHWAGGGWCARGARHDARRHATTPQDNAPDRRSGYRRVTPSPGASGSRTVPPVIVAPSYGSSASSAAPSRSAKSSSGARCAAP
jgi:hypothetical protein